MKELQIFAPEDYESDYFVDGKEIISVNHDEHGWAGMNAVQKALTIMAGHCGLSVVGIDERPDSKELPSHADAF